MYMFCCFGDLVCLILLVPAVCGLCTLGCWVLVLVCCDFVAFDAVWLLGLGGLLFCGC